MAIPDPETSTHVYKNVDGLELTMDVVSPAKNSTSSADAGPRTALIHYHGGFLVIGEKTTFPPSWLINACMRRGWTYVTPSYRLLPESTGLDIVADALDAANWVTTNITERLVVAGSSAGGFLALSVANLMTAPSPLAVLSIYGMLDLASSRYIEPGTTLMGSPPIPDTSAQLAEMKAAAGAVALSGYPFPQDPRSDKRMAWIAAAHQDAIYPDLVTRLLGLSETIRKKGVDAIPAEFRSLFPVACGLRKDLPPTAFLHGDDDNAVGDDQSIQVSKKLKGLGVKVTCEIVSGKGHGFDVREIPADVDIESQGAGQEPMYQQLRNILIFLDGAVN